MILVSNVKITNTPLKNNFDRGLLQRSDRLDIWLYTLSSYIPALPLISKVILYVDVASTEYADKQDTIENELNAIFPTDKLIIHWYRNNSTNEWRRSCERDIFTIDDDIIFNLNNDDHVFIDSDIFTLTRCIDRMREVEDPMIYTMYTHWPEIVRIAQNNNWDRVPGGNLLQGRRSAIEGIEIVKRDRWEYYWFEHDYGDSPGFFRTDGLAEMGITLDAPIIIPTKEIVRHFDGYSHAGKFNNITPPLIIPPGFFEKQMRLAYGYAINKEGYTNIDPSRDSFSVDNGDGADFRFTLEDIPAMWEDRILEVDINPNADLEYLRELRDQHIYNMSSIAISVPLVENAAAPFDSQTFKNNFRSQKWINNMRDAR